MRTTLWGSTVGDIQANMAFINNLAAVAAPTTVNDISQGYEPGSVWVFGNVWYGCTSNALGAATWVVIADGETTPGQLIAPAASTPTGNGSSAAVKGGTGGATSGGGGSVVNTGGAATAGNSNGGSVIRRGGVATGTGVPGTFFTNYPAPPAKTVSATLTPAEALSGLITVNQGAAAGSTITMPLGTDLEAAMPPDIAVGDCFDLAIQNVSVVDAEDVTVAGNTGVVFITGTNLTIEANSAVTKIAAATFRFRRTAASTFSGYRLT